MSQLHNEKIYNSHSLSNLGKIKASETGGVCSIKRKTANRIVVEEPSGKKTTSRHTRKSIYLFTYLIIQCKRTAVLVHAIKVYGKWRYGPIHS